MWLKINPRIYLKGVESPSSKLPPLAILLFLNQRQFFSVIFLGVFTYKSEKLNP